MMEGIEANFGAGIGMPMDQKKYKVIKQIF